MQKKKHCSLIAFLVVLVVLFASVRSAHAATMTLSPSRGTFSVGDTVKVNVVIASPSESVNALSSTVSFPSSLLSLTSVSKAGSAVSLWVQEPTYSNRLGTATFEGVILNGFKGPSATVLTLNFKAIKAGNAEVKIQAASVLANDGAGTNVLTAMSGALFSIEPRKEIEIPVVTPEVPNQNTQAPILNVQEIEKLDSQVPKARFLITYSGSIQGQAYSIQIDSGDTILWIDDGTHIFETALLARGAHTIKITTESKNGISASSALDFVIDTMTQPVITQYPTKLYRGEYMALRGTADPFTEVVITFTKTNGTSTLTLNNTTLSVMLTKETVYLRTDGRGIFTYVSDKKATVGVYSVRAFARTDSGVESEPTDPLIIPVDDSQGGLFGFTGIHTVLVGIAFLVVLVLFAVFIFFVRKRVGSFRGHVESKMSETHSVLSNTLELLKRDKNKEAVIFYKIREHEPLTEDERSYLTRLRKKVNSVEEITEKEREDIERILSGR